MPPARRATRTRNFSTRGLQKPWLFGTPFVEGSRRGRRKSLGIKGDSPDAIRIRAQALTALERWDEAIHVWHALTKVVAGEAGAHFELGRAHYTRTPLPTP